MVRLCYFTHYDDAMIHNAIRVVERALVYQSLLSITNCAFAILAYGTSKFYTLPDFIHFTAIGWLWIFTGLLGILLGLLNSALFVSTIIDAFGRKLLRISPSNPPKFALLFACVSAGGSALYTIVLMLPIMLFQFEYIRNAPTFD